MTRISTPLLLACVLWTGCDAQEDVEVYQHLSASNTISGCMFGIEMRLYNGQTVIALYRDDAYRMESFAWFGCDYFGDPNQYGFYADAWAAASHVGEDGNVSLIPDAYYCARAEDGAAVTCGSTMEPDNNQIIPRMELHRFEEDR